MKHLPLESRVVRSAGYEPSSRTLELEFADGRIYRYFDVPEGTFTWLLRAPSKGAFIARMVVPRHACRDVTPLPAGTEADLCEALRASLVDPKVGPT